jgi:type I restriction enzyme S subunit
MNVDTFFKKFELFADAPNAVGKMRELILHLAVTGKLVWFDTKQRPQTVGDHVSFLNGYAFKSEWFKPFGIRLCRNANVGHGFLNWQDTVFVDQNVADEFHRFALQEGDIVLSLDRPIITTGLKVAQIRKADLPCLLLQRVAKPVARHDLLYLNYFFLWLNSPVFVRSIDPGRSNGVPHISTRQVLDLPFTPPPLAEQKRIVAKVDELMALCDRLEAQQQERETRHIALAHASLTRFADAPTPENLELLFHKAYSIEPGELRKSILTLAVQGKLVRQDAQEQPADHLNSEIPSQLSTLADYAGTRFIAPNKLIDVLDGLPVGWGVAQLQSIGITQTGTTPSKSEPHFTGTYIPFIKPGDMKAGCVDYDNEGLSKEGLAVGRLIPRNSILMVSIGGSIGKTAFVNRDVSCNQQINCISPVKCIDARFLFIAMSASDFQDEVMNRAAQGTLPIISKSKWETIPVPIPPLPEQRRIVAKVDQLMALVDQLEVQLAEARGKAAALLDAVVAELSVAA